MKWQAGLEFIVGCFGIYGIGRLTARQWVKGLGFLFLLTPLVLFTEGFINEVFLGDSIWFVVLVQVGIAFFDAWHLNTQLKEVHERQEPSPVTAEEAQMRELWKFGDKRPVRTLQVHFFDNGDDDRCYVTVTFSEGSNIHYHLSLLLPLLFEHQLITLLEPYAERLALRMVSWMTNYKRSSVPPVPTLNLPAPDVPLVLSTRIVLLKDSAGGYAVNFFPKFEGGVDEDNTVVRFLWAFLIWVLTHIGNEGLRVLMLSQLDLLCNAFSRGPRTLENSPLRRPDFQVLISKLGWTVPWQDLEARYGMLDCN
jgi:hypothetical protein